MIFFKTVILFFRFFFYLTIQNDSVAVNEFIHSKTETSSRKSDKFTLETEKIMTFLENSGYVVTVKVCDFWSSLK